MLLRTHLAFSVFVIVLFITHVNNPWIFSLMVLVGSVLPDIDSGFSSWGRHLMFRPLQFFVKHRGIIHSLTTAVVVSIVLAIFWPIVSLGFFVGYSTHLILDSFTREGIQPFWPLKGKSHGFISSGGRIEDGIFISLVLVDVMTIIILLIF